MVVSTAVHTNFKEDPCLTEIGREGIEASSGAKFLRAPFQGGDAGINALVGGKVDLAQGFYAEFRRFLDANKVVPVAVAASERLLNVNDVPTFNEVLGGNEYVWNVIRFVVAPIGVSADHKAYLAAGVRVAMEDPELINENRKVGAYFNPKLASSTRIADDLNQHAERERGFACLNQAGAGNVRHNADCAYPDRADNSP